MTQATLRTEKARLTEQNLAKAARLQRYDALAAENAHLRELLEARRRPEIDSARPREILYADATPSPARS